MIRCASCEAPIIWALTVSGKRIAVDAEPSPVANLILRNVAKGIQPVAEPFRREEWNEPFPPRFYPHLKTCPNHNRHRKNPI